MAKRIPFIDGYEQDYLTKWKRYIGARAGVRKYVKKKYNKRERRQVKSEIHKSLSENTICEP